MICFHHNDLDGWCAAAVVAKFNPECRFVEVDYSTRLPVERIKPDEPVIIVDYTPEKKEDFQAVINATTHRPVWIDHHWKNVQKHSDLSFLPGLRSDTKPSAALLTWRHFFGESVPTAVSLASDYDTWVQSPECINFNFGMELWDHRPQSPVWRMLLGDRQHAEFILNRIMMDGSVVVDYRKQWSDVYRERNAYEIQFEGLRCLTCNVAMINSLFFSSRIKDYDAVIRWHFDGKDFEVGMYTERKDVNLAAIAMKYGGGGHPQAAGFRTKHLPWNLDQK